MGRFRPSFAPVESSNLRILSGPASPASPKSPSTRLHFPNLPSPRAIPPHVFDERYQVTIGLPSTPMPWIWSCHKCHTRYPLGATRRCLQDGHYFCGGTTVDPINGKVKKHRACVSEFDYTGWEDFGKWKGATNGRSVKHGAKHCQDECDFPSCCHWKEQDALQNTKLDFTDPNCLDKKPDRTLIKGKIRVQESTRNYVEKLRRAAEKHTMQVAKASLSPIEEEDQQALPSGDTRPRFNGLGLHFPVVDFSKSKNSDTRSRQLVDKTQTNLEILQKAHMSAQMDDVLEEDVDMKEWITGSPPSYSCPQPDAVQMSFDFKFEQGSLSLSDDDSPISPMRSVWDWTAGGIGTALSPPALPVEGERWEEEMEDELNAVDMLWGEGELEKGGADMKPHRVDCKS